MFQSMLNHLLTMLDSFMDNKYQPLVDTFQPLAATIFGIYLLAVFVLIMTNKADKPKELLWTLFWAAIIVGVVFNYSLYKHWILDPIVGLSFNLQGFFLTGSGAAPTSFFSQVDEAFAELFFTVETIADNGSVLTAPLVLLVAVLLGLLYGMLYVVFSALMLFAIFSLYVFFVIGGIPLFLAIMPQTRFVFWAWLRAVANYALIPVFTAIVMAISMQFLDAVVNDLVRAEVRESVFSLPVGMAFLVGAISIWLHLKAPEYSSALTGGQASGATGALMTGGAAAVAGTKIGINNMATGAQKALTAGMGLYSKWRGL